MGFGTPSSSHVATHDHDVDQAPRASVKLWFSTDQWGAHQRSVPAAHSDPGRGSETCGSGHLEAVIQHPCRPSCNVSTHGKRRRREDSRWQRNSQGLDGDEAPGGLLSVWHAGMSPQPDAEASAPQQARRDTARGSMDKTVVKHKKDKSAKKEKKDKKDKSAKVSQKSFPP